MKTKETSEERQETQVTDYNYVHWVLQKKGGIGKTLVALILSQYIRSTGKPVEVVDTDPSNATLFAYKALNAQRLDLMEGTVLNESKFDALIMRIVTEDTNFVIDNGASSYLQLNNYMIENFVIDMIAEHGKQVVVHVVVAGGSHFIETLSAFRDLAENLPEQAKIVVWVNKHLGPIQGVPFEETNVYLKYKDRVAYVIDMPALNKATYGADMERMLTAKLTFDEIKMCPEFDLMKKARLSRVKQDFYNQLDKLQII